ncbi:hypothetical protein A9Z42_0025490 [Trichoderma parareesei]|uniref:DUF6603 domain-containing protein n=1 Tax=Trichoderma parareesei TaxID=858221 RepID=A0A2H2Z2U6_TRIPA|nr:hypothetical protein A9Z42_0025490 [Trichoderma parareesei]
MTKYRVDSFHVAISLGDSAIHLLVDVTDVTAKDPKPKVLSAVLIDGGEDQPGRHKDSGDTKHTRQKKMPIYTAMRWIENNYIIDGKEVDKIKRLAFDTIIITHWDKDHYHGIVEILQNGATTEDKTEQLDTILKWNIDETPATHFYCSVKTAWERTKSKKANGMNNSFRVDDADNTISIKFKKDGKEDWAKFAKFHAADKGTDDVLGVDFFKNDAAIMPGSDGTPLVDLLKAKKLEAGRPAMLCIAANERHFASKTEISKLAIDKPINILVVKDTSVTLTNQASIACLIVWEATPAPHVSHYFAGDIGQKHESTMFNWLKTAGVKKITNVKLSHHGSHFSTPLPMFTDFQPKNTLVPTPTYALHNHPSWPVIVIWFLWAHSLAPPAVPRLVALTFPATITWVPESETEPEKGSWYNLKDVKLDALQGKKDYKTYVTYHDKQYEVLNEALVKNDKPKVPNERLDRIKQAEDIQRAYVADRYAQIWSLLGFPTTEYHMGGCGIYSVTQGKTAYKSLCFVRIKCSQNTDEDGELQYVDLGSSLPHTPTPIVIERAMVLTALKTTVTPSTAVAAAIPAAPGAVSRKRKLSDVDDDMKEDAENDEDDRVTDYDLLSHARVQPQAFFIPKTTNPDEMDSPPGDEGDEEHIEGMEEYSLVDTSSATTGEEIFEAQVVSLSPKVQSGGGVVNLNTNPSGMWSVFTRRLEDTKIKAQGVNDYERLDPGLLNEFVSDLHCGVICLEKRPEDDPPPNGTTPLSKVDEWAAWFADVLNAKDLAVIDAKGHKIGGFTMQVSLAPIGAGPGSPSTTWLKFSTERSILEIAFGLASAAFISPEGLLKQNSGLVFGLHPSTPSEPVNIVNMLNFAGLGSLQKNPLIAMMGAMALKPPSTNDELKNKRNAVWFVPGNDYRTCIRLEWQMDDTSREELNSIFEPLQLTLGETTVVTRRSTWWTTSGTESKLISRGDLVIHTNIDLEGIKLEGLFEFNETASTFTMTLNTKNTSALVKLLAWVSKLLDIDVGQFDFTSLENQSVGSFSLGEFHFRRITVGLTKDEWKGKAKMSTFRIDMEVELDISSQGPTLFLVTYSYKKEDGSSISAKIWTAPPAMPALDQWRLLPEWENYYEMSPISIDVSKWQTTLDLAAMADIDDAPSFLPTQVTMAEFQADKSGISFTGAMQPKPQKGDKVPIFSIGEIALYVGYEWGGKKSTVPSKALATAKSAGKFTGVFLIKALIQQPKGAKYGWPTQLIGQVVYTTDNGWVLSGSIYDLYASTLAQFFDSNLSGTALSILETIKVQELNINYTYQKKAASSFDIDGILVLGPFKLSLKFTNDGKVWDFEAKVNTDQNKDVTSTVGEIIHSIADTDLNLPDFLTNIEIGLKKEDYLELIMKKVQLGTSDKYVMVVLITARLSGLIFQYLQFREIVDEGVKAPPVKRFLSASVGELVDTALPMIGKIPQPFDDILFLWVQGQGQAQPEKDGITKIQLESINKVLVDMKKKPMPYKTVSKSPPGDGDVLLTRGMHFMVLRKKGDSQSEVILDYAFEKTKTQPPAGNELVLAKDDGGVEDKGAAMTPYQTRKGPLSIKNIGLKYSTGSSGKESIVSIRLDASVTIGPVEFGVMGLALNLNFAGSKELSLHNLPKPNVTLEGIAAGFNRPPITIAGGLLYHNDNDRMYYAGAIQVGYTPWLFQAAGYYGKIKKPKEFETIFLFCVLKGPLITLEFVSIEGVTGGFGYNSNLKFPTAHNILQFPLITGDATDPDPKDGPFEIMNQLLGTSWFFPEEGSFWVAAGLTVKAFEILSVEAVIVIQWNPYVQLGIFGLATASIPGGASKVKFAHVQLGIVASLNFETGVLKIEGELTPASYILDPNCHLTGGFALYSWFDSKDEALRGDWVFTIGGYHPSFSRPPGYPEVPRLGISWQFGGAISISGKAYFAITPKVCMGGGRLDVALSLDPLYAYFNAFVDFLINFKPFYFIAEGGLTVGVKFTLDLWLVTVNINIEISAKLYIKGPPIQGRVHVDFWVFGFDIDFGASKVDQPPPLLLDEFIAVVCQAKNAGIASMMIESALGLAGAPEEASNSPDAFVFAVEEGLIPKDDVKSKPSGDMWNVRAATFEFSVNCKFAVESAKIETRSPDGKLLKTDDVRGTGNPIYAKPMQTDQPISSTLTISIKANKDVDLEEIITEPVWTINESICKDVPLALWGQYNRSDDPSYNRNPQSMLNGTKGKSVYLMMGVHLTRPLPLLSLDKTVPYDVVKFQISTLDNNDHIAMPDEPTKAFSPIPALEEGQWDAVQEKWDRPLAGENAAEQTVNLWAALGLGQLGWSKKNVYAEKAALTGAKPRRVIDNLAKYYLWSPVLSGV